MSRIDDLFDFSGVGDSSVRTRLYNLLSDIDADSVLRPLIDQIGPALQNLRNQEMSTNTKIKIILDDNSYGSNTASPDGSIRISKRMLGVLFEDPINGNYRQPTLEEIFIHELVHFVRFYTFNATNYEEWNRYTYSPASAPFLRNVADNLLNKIENFAQENNLNILEQDILYRRYRQLGFSDEEENATQVTNFILERLTGGDFARRESYGSTKHSSKYWLDYKTARGNGLNEEAAKQWAAGQQPLATIALSILDLEDRPNNIRAGTLEGLLVREPTFQTNHDFQILIKDAEDVLDKYVEIVRKHNSLSNTIEEIVVKGTRETPGNPAKAQIINSDGSVVNLSDDVAWKLSTLVENEPYGFGSSQNILWGEQPDYADGLQSVWSGPRSSQLSLDFEQNGTNGLFFDFIAEINAHSFGKKVNSDLFDALKAIGLGPNGIIGGTYFTDEELDMLARVRVATTREELDATGKRIATEVRQDLGLELGDVVARDSSGRIILENGKPKIVGKDIFTENGGRVRTYTDGPLNGITRIDIAGAFIDFRDAGAILGNLLGKSLAGDNKLAQVALSTTLKTVGNALGSALNGSVTGASQQDISRVFDSMGREFVRNLQLKGAGAVSAYLASEIVNVLGIDGFVGELTSTAAGEFLRSAVTNFLGVANNNIAFNVGNAIGALIGSKLASKVHQFHSVGGQIGAQIGAVVGNILLGGAIGTFLGQLIGGTIGSIFGGTPRSGADVQWDETMGAFTVANVWSKKGGSKEAAKGIAQSVANTYNGLVATIGGELLDPDAIQAGNYGMRSTKFVYRPISSRDKDDITATFKGKDAPEDLINYGLLQGFSDPDFLIAGGDILAKRAFYRTVELADNSDDFQAALVGNIATAQSYRNYLRNAPLINAIIAGSAETQDSEFAAEVAMTLIHADELGLNRRHWSDWIGGYSWLLEAAGVTAGTVTMRYEIDPFSQRLERVYDLGYGAYNPRDVIDVAGQDIIEGTSAADTINLTGGQIADVRNLTVNGKVQNDIAVTGSDFTHKTGTLSFATGDLRQAFYVSVVNDGVTEVAETLLASLSNASGMTIMGGAATITVRNANAGVPQLLVGKSYAYEGDGYAVFRVSLSKAASGAVSLSFALSDGRAAGQGVDYTAAGMQVSSNGTSWTTASTATLTAGMTQMFVRVPVKTDALNEGAEDFRLTATVTTGASYVATTTASNTGTILNGASATPLVWIDDVVVDEATGAATVTVSRNKTAATVNTVQYATQDRRTKTIGIAATVDGGAGNDRIDASDLGDNILGGAGDDTLYGGRLDDWLFGGDGNDILNAGAADTTKLGGDGNYLDGGAGNDTLTGREGSDWLEGGAGNDTLAAQGGDDILGGGAGVDTLQGGDGSDQYMLRRGDGADTVTDDPGTATTSTDPVTTRLAGLSNGSITRDWLANGVYSAHGAPYGGGDSLVLGPGIGMGDIQLMRGGTNNMDLILKVYTTVNGVKTLSGDQITLKEWFNSYKKVEWLVFADGQAIRIGDITSFIIGTADNDVIVGTTGNDFVVGGAGDDRLELLPGDDVGLGGKGRDMIAGDADRDLIIGGDDDDWLLGGSGDDVILGDDGNDNIYGGAGKEVLAGGKGDDIIAGGGDGDVFRYSRGDGKDQIIDEYAGTWESVWVNGAYATDYTYDSATNRVLKGTEVVFDGTNWIGRYDYDYTTLTLKRLIPPATGPLTMDATINDTFQWNGIVLPSTGADTLEFGLGINIQDILMERQGNDLVLGVAAENAEVADFALLADQIRISDWFVSYDRPIESFSFVATGQMNMEGINIIAGSNGNDTVTGTLGADWMVGNGGDDTLAGNSGNDILNGGAGRDTLKGDAGDDIIYGGAGDDVLDGGLGKDTLVGGAGSDTVSYASSTATAGVTVYLDDANASLRTGDAFGDVYAGVENITGSGYADRLYGDSGDNVLDGGGGNDTLQGNSGDDTYILANGSGQDTVTDQQMVSETIIANYYYYGILQPGYTVIWTSLGLSGGYYRYRLQVQKVSTGEFVYDCGTTNTYNYSTPKANAPGYVNGQYYVNASTWNRAYWTTGCVFNGNAVIRNSYASDGGLDTLEIGDNLSLSDLTFTRTGNDLIVSIGTGINKATIKDFYTSSNAQIETLQFADGLSADLTKLIIGALGATTAGQNNVDDLIVGSTGNETLQGLSGNDVLSGGAGNDNLQGGDGDDVLEGGAGADALNGGAGVDTIRYARSSAAVTINLATGAASGGDAAGDTLTDIENIVGSIIGGDSLTGSSGNNQLFGLDGNDTLDGGAGHDVLVGGKGHDILYGRDGDDNIAGEEGNDWFSGGNGNDLLDGGDGNDVLYGEAGNDQLIGGVGTDTLDGGVGDDILVGGDDNDALVGGDGNDVLVGGVGNDSLHGWKGNDVYVFDVNSGQDTVVDAYDTNTILIDGNVSIDQVWMTRSGNDLRIGVIGSPTIVTVQGYYNSTSPSRIASVATATHAVYLAYAVPLINAMTAAQITTPAAMPDSVATTLATYWHEGGRVAPMALAYNIKTLKNTTSTSTYIPVTDQNANITGYALAANPGHGTVNLNTTTGYFTYTPASNYTGLDTFTVQVRDGDGFAVDVPVTVSVNPGGTNRVNTLPQSYTFSSIQENKPIGTAVGTVAATDPDGTATAGQQRYYFLNNGVTSNTSADGRYKINATSGQITTNAILDYESGMPETSYTVVARDNAGGAGYNQTTTTVVIKLQDVNENPINVNDAPTIGNQTVQVQEQPVNPTLPVAQLAWDDPDGKPINGHRFSITSGNSAGYWRIDNAGRMVLAKSLNYENASYRNFTLGVKVSDAAGLSAQATITINATNVNEAPRPILSASSVTLASGATTNTTVATVTSSGDPDIGDTVTYSMSWKYSNSTTWTAGAFSLNGTSIININSTTGRLYTASTIYFFNPIDIQVTATDAGGLQGVKQIRVNGPSYFDINPVVLDLDGDGLEMVPLASSGVTIDVNNDGEQDLTGWVLPDDGFLALDRNNSGTIDAINEISFSQDVEGALSDLEGLRFYDTNSDGLFDANDAQFSDFRVWRDLNQDGVGTANELFTLSSLNIANINLTLTPTGNERTDPLDNLLYGTSEYQRTDGTFGQVGDMIVTALGIESVMPSLVDVDSAATEVSEDSQGGTTVGLMVGIQDADPARFTFTLVDDAGGLFAIDPHTGVVSLAAGATLDYETASQAQITVLAADGDLAVEQAFTIAITDANDAPTEIVDQDETSDQIGEGAAAGAQVGITAHADDADANASITYSLDDDAGGLFVINSQTGVISVAQGAVLDAEASSSHIIQVRADDGMVSSVQSFTISIVNGAPTGLSDIDATANLVVEHAATSTPVGIMAQAQDPSGGTLTYRLVDDAQGRFAIDPSTGVVTVADGTLIDYEMAASYDITIEASDGIDADIETFSITVQDDGPKSLNDIDTAINNVLEGSASGTIVGITASASDPSGGAITYTLLDDAGGRFVIDPVSGIVTVASSASLDHEISSSHTITVQASNNLAGESKTFTINIVDTADNTITGTENGDTLTGTENADVINGLGGADTIYGLGGNDIITGGGNSDVMYGGDGDDTFTIGTSLYAYFDIFDGGGGYDTIAATADEAIVYINSNESLAGIEAITADGFSNVEIRGASNPDTINLAGVALSGIMVIDGRSGDDIITGSDSNDTIIGAQGNDTLYGGAGDDLFLISGSSHGSDTFYGGDGIDTIAATTNDTIIKVPRTTTGLNGIEIITGAGHNGVILRGSASYGDDTLDFTGVELIDVAVIDGQNYNDLIVGSAGNDVILGGGGNDTLLGGDGDDIFQVGGSSAGVDSFNGGEGYDSIIATADNTLIGISSSGFNSIEEISAAGYANVKTIGTTSADTLDFTNTSIIGISAIDGLAGNDSITGSSGSDTIIGGTGNDTLNGGAGNDVYSFDASSGQDIVIDASGINNITFDATVTYDDIWITRSGNDLRVGVIGSSSVVTVKDYYASTNPTKLHTITTTTHSISLSYAASLIDDMTSIQVATPSSMPSSIAVQFADYWFAGTTFAPVAEAINVKTLVNTASNSTSPEVWDMSDNITGYALTTTPGHGSVSLNNATGAFVYTPDTDFTGTDTFALVVTDSDGFATEIPVTVSVNPGGSNSLNSLPANGYYFDTISENQSIGASVGTVTATDPDSGALGEQRYGFLEGGAFTTTTSDGRYAINTLTGEITTAAVLDYEASVPTTSYTVAARDNQGNAGYNQVTTNVTIALQDVSDGGPASNTAPSLSNQSFVIAENPANRGAVMATLAWDDVDGKPANGHRFSIVSGNADGYWTIDNEGRIYLSQDKYLNYEDLPHQSFTLGIQVTDQEGTGLSTQATIDIDLSNVNEAPQPAISSTNVVLGTTVGAGSVLAQVTAGDPDFGEVPTFSMAWRPASNPNGTWQAGAYSDDNGTAININSSGQLSMVNDYVASATPIDIDIQITVTDGEGLTGTTQLHVRSPYTPAFMPVVFDLDNDGLELVDSNTWKTNAGGVSRTYFDSDVDGLPNWTGWVGADDGMLALDKNSDGAIATRDEISFITNVGNTPDNLGGLAIYDSNSDGILDSNDSQFGNFYIWRDVNQNGVSETSELHRLSDLGIAQINLTLMTAEPSVDLTSDAIIAQAGSFLWSNGDYGLAGDVMLLSGTNVVAAPIVIDLDGDGVTLTDPGQSDVSFDLNNDGILDSAGWIEAEDAFLVLDRNNDDVINNALEISFIGDLPGAGSDLEGLAAFDSNDDGVLSASDNAFPLFRLWKDANSNGITDMGELLSLSDLGISAISLSPNDTVPMSEGANTIYHYGALQFDDGQYGVLADVGLAYMPGSPPEEQNTSPEDAGESTSDNDVANSSNEGNVDTQNEATASDSHEMHFDRKAKHFKITTSSGQLFVRPRGEGALVDAQAGKIVGTTVLTFKNKEVGLASPIILDLDGDGIDMKSRKNSKALFDMDGDGRKDDTGWLGKGDAFLVLDRNGNGTIDDISEMSFFADKEGAKSDLDGLTAFDSNHDGKLNAQDAGFAEFKLWKDANRDGVTDAGELVSLTDAGISEISLTAHAVDRDWKVGENIVVNTTTFRRTDGSVGTVGDVALAFKPTPEPVATNGVWEGLGNLVPEQLLAALAASDEPGLAALRQAAGTAPAFPLSGGNGASGQLGGSLSADPDQAMNDPQIARMVQAMAVFGATESLERWRMLGLNAGDSGLALMASPR